MHTNNGIHCIGTRTFQLYSKKKIKETKIT